MSFEPEDRIFFRPELSSMAAMLVLVLLMLLGSGIGNGLAFLLGKSMGLSLTEVIQSFSRESPLAERNFLRATTLFSHLFTFALPAILLASLLYRRQWVQFLKLDRFLNFNILSAGVFFLLGTFVLSQLAYWLNRQIPLPYWASDMESSAGRLVQGLLVMESPWELAFTVLVVAILPALGEELVFRGVLQQALEKATGRPVAAIWIAALIFSAFHLQFAGLLPRLLLGAGLGYLFYWTGSLWAPIIAHFVINGVQVAGQYYQQQNLPETSLQEVNWPAIGIAAVLVAGLSSYLYRYHKNHNRPPVP
ncbi:MAG: CPBP family intramembrane metalloprotease [Phaeodactylibacter sp.]|nr:CPBP family intramembrane metalloprotease [Phaeodactylibacter sp.]MCB9052027.1 CPBP family intramembrane metalloprotease [Lewinellaceae bacterium]